MDTSRSHSDSILVAASPEALYNMVSDVTRTGEWSPICKSCWWDEGAGPTEGAWFNGHNEAGGMEWDTRSLVEVAEPGREFAWLVGGGFVRWGYTFAPEDGMTRVTESWELRPEGVTMFHDKYGDGAKARIELRTEQARTGIPATLAAIKKIAESA